MRSAGTLVDVRDLGAHDHCCWVFDRHADFLEGSFASLTAGIQHGLRGIYVGAGSADALEREVRQFAGADRLLDDGSLQVRGLENAYGSAPAIDPARQVSAYSKATNDALADGFAGLRVAADATNLIGTQDQLDVFARYEHLIDRYMADHPFSAICGYWAGGAVEREAATRISSLHPLTVTEVAPFRFFAKADGTFALSGEIDYFDSSLLEWALQRAEAADRPGEILIDMSGVEFIEHHGLEALARYAIRHDNRMVLVRAPSIVRRVTKLLDIPGIVFSEEN